jgi:myo-inositol catabolism protein IolS
MRHRALGRSGLGISVIVAGGWQAGREDWIGIDDADSIAAYRAAFDHGVTAFDTAEEYGGGHSERLLAAALGHVREQIVIATKVSWRHLRREAVIRACERSLANLRTDRIDLYQVHWPAGSFGSEVVPLEETMGALAELRQQGKIRAIGVSNFDRAQLEQASALTRVDSLQPPYSLLWRKIEAELRPYCVEHQIAILAYSPLAQGLLTGRFGPDHRFPPGDNRSDNKLFQGETHARAQAALARLSPIAARCGVTLGQLALAWVCAQPETVAVVGARTAAQAAANAAAGDVQLSDEDLAAIDAIGRTVTDPMDADPVMWSWEV